MKDIFDNYQIGDLKLNSRVVRTALWQTQDIEEVFEKYENIAKSGVGLIITEIISIYPKDKFSEYSFKINSPSFMIEAKRLNALYNYRIVAVNGLVKCPYAQKNIKNAGPQEFVNLIKNSEFVLCNSFHATSFSIIFNRPFATFYKHKNISRMADLLECVGLKDSLNAQKPKYEYNWDKVNEKLVEMCALSYDYIRKNTVTI